MSQLLTIEQAGEQPRWLDALEKFREARFQFGDVVPHEWFWAVLGLEKLHADTLMRVADLQRRNFLYAESIVQMRGRLLQEDSIYLEVEHGVGYRLVEPGEQTSIVMNKGLQRVSREFKKMHDGVTHVQTHVLSDRERSENASAREKISWLRDTLRKRLPGPADD